MENTIAALEARIAQLEAKQEAMQALLERTPLNDEMQAAVRIALDGEEWFQDLVRSFAEDALEDMVSNMRSDLESDLEQQIEREVESAVENAVDHATSQLARDVERLDGELQDVADRVTALEGLDGLDDRVDDLESRVVDLEGESK